MFDAGLIRTMPSEFVPPDFRHQMARRIDECRESSRCPVVDIDFVPPRMIWFKMYCHLQRRVFRRPPTLTATMRLACPKRRIFSPHLFSSVDIVPEYVLPFDKLCLCKHSIPFSANRKNIDDVRRQIQLPQLVINIVSCDANNS